jgi:hypothetical protein
MFRAYWIFCTLLLFPLASAASDPTQVPGVLEGHLHIISLKTVELGDRTLPTVTPETYAEYPLVVLTHGNEKEVATVTADAKGYYRLSLPPGEYVLDIKNRARKHVRAKPQEFTVLSDQTIQVNIEMDTGIR